MTNNGVNPQEIRDKLVRDIANQMINGFFAGKTGEEVGHEITAARDERIAQLVRDGCPSTIAVFVYSVAELRAVDMAHEAMCIVAVEASARRRDHDDLASSLN